MSAEEQNEHDCDFGAAFGGDPVAGQVPGQGGAPVRESLADSPHGVGAVSARVPGQANAGQGGVTPEAFVSARASDRAQQPAVGKVPPPADPVDGDRPPPTPS